jgi:hypothetical protein
VAQIRDHVAVDMANFADVVARFTVTGRGRSSAWCSRRPDYRPDASKR